MKKFEVGKIYSCRSIGDSDCIFAFEILKRTKSTVTINARGDVTTRRVFELDGGEAIYPLGKYSMAPLLRA